LKSPTSAIGPAGRGVDHGGDVGGPHQEIDCRRVQVRIVELERNAANVDQRAREAALFVGSRRRSSVLLQSRIGKRLTITVPY
jgi:hypothetical protein